MAIKDYGQHERFRAGNNISVVGSSGDDSVVTEVRPAIKVGRLAILRLELRLEPVQVDLAVLQTDIKNDCLHKLYRRASASARARDEERFELTSTHFSSHKFVAL